MNQVTDDFGTLVSGVCREREVAVAHCEHQVHRAACFLNCLPDAMSIVSKLLECGWEVKMNRRQKMYTVSLVGVTLTYSGCSAFALEDALTRAVLSMEGVKNAPR